MLRIGGHALEVVGEHPFGRIAEHRLDRWADVAELQAIVGGEDHIADALRQQPGTLLAVTQRLAAFDLFGDVLDHAEQTADATRGVPGEGLLAHAEPAPTTVSMAPAQLRFEQ